VIWLIAFYLIALGTAGFLDTYHRKER